MCFYFFFLIEKRVAKNCVKIIFSGPGRSFEFTTILENQQNSSNSNDQIF